MAHLSYVAKSTGSTILCQWKSPVLKERKHDFCLLQCSLSSVLGGLGFVAYAAANTFVDAFAHKHNQTNPGPWVSVNWDGRQLGEGKVQSIAPGATLAELAIKPEESAEVFEHILAVGAVDQVVISTGDLQARIDRWIKRESLRGTDRLEEADVSSPRSRLNLQSAYVAPRNEIEQAIADIWQELLGIDQVGIYDNFFELGGHSLLASQLISRLRQTLPVELPLRTLLETPTVAQIGKVVEEMLIEKVKVLSEDEVRRLL